MNRSEENNEYNFEKLTDQEKLDIAVFIAEKNLNVVNESLDEVEFKESFYSKYLKRIIDVMVSVPAVIVFSPINIVLAILTLFDVGRPILFFQVRSGKDNKPFKFGKFRNMTNQRDEKGILLQASERVTTWGKFVRKTSLDELLNFWYILIGKMSLIGPRPMPDEYIGRYNKRHIMRHAVRPGLECPLHSKKYNDRMDWLNRFENDVWYVEHVSILTDLKLFFLLINDTLFSKRKSFRGDAKLPTFMGYFPDGKIMTSDDIPMDYYKEFFDQKNEKKKCSHLSR